MKTEIDVSSVDKTVILSKISWSAALAGTAIGLCIYFSLVTLGLSLGLAIMDFKGGVSLTAVTWGSGIWHVLFGTVSVAIGAYIAGRLSKNLGGFAGAANGLLVWALMSLTTIYFVTQSAILAVSGATDVMGMVGGGLKSAIPEIGQQELEDFAKTLGFDEFELSKLQKNLESINIPDVKEAAVLEYKEMRDIVFDSLKNGLVDPDSLDSSIERIQNKLRDSAERFDELLTEEKIEEIIRKNSSLSKTEVSAAATNWRNELDKLRKRIDKRIPEAKSKLKKFRSKTISAADSSINKLGSFFAVMFFMLLIGFVASIFSGMAGVKSSRYKVI